MTVCVFGSLNMDLVIRTLKLPLAGETVRGHGFELIPGGKGANQAVALARQGIAVEMVGRVGHDSYGNQLLDHLDAESIGLDGVVLDPAASSGLALITVADNGENHIVLAAGANGRVNLTDVERLKPLLGQGPSHSAKTRAKFLMLQLEVPLPAVLAAAKAAKAIGIPVILDPAPALGMLPEDFYGLVDIITPNQLEAARIAGFPVTTLQDAQGAARTIQKRGIPEVVVTLGEAGACCATKDAVLTIPPFKVRTVDTTASGDAFNGAMVAALCQGRSLYEACVWGNGAGALAATRQGTLRSLPNAAELEDFLSRHGANIDLD
jgi:ribokinase